LERAEGHLSRETSGTKQRSVRIGIQSGMEGAILGELE